MKARITNAAVEQPIQQGTMLNGPVQSERAKIVHKESGRTSRRTLTTSILYSALTLLQAAVIVAGHNHNSHHHDQEVTICGTEPPDPVLAALDVARVNLFKQKKGGRIAQAESCDDLCKQCIEIEVYIHIMQFDGQDFGLDYDFIPHPRDNVQLLVDFGDTSLTADDWTSVDDMLQLVVEQMVVLNKYFADTPFFFTHMERDDPSVTVNTDWARYAQDEAFDMSAALYRGDRRTLNLYFGAGVDSRAGAEAGSTIVAFARFPSWQMGNFSDGIFQRYDTLPGGGFPLNDIGITTVHEAGHWLGLYHTFMNANGEGSDPCSPNNSGDIIEDTPAQGNDTQALIADCTIFSGPDPEPFPDSCPEQPGLDPVFNFMNYVNDESCHAENGEFTCRQVERMAWQWQLWRDSEPVCDDGEMEVDIAIQFEEKPEGEEWTDTFFIVAAEGETVFNSTTDYDSSLASFGAPIAIALCLQNNDYAFIYNDGEGNGFASDEKAYIEIIQNGEQLARISGDFGPQAIVEISQAPGAPTLPPPTDPPTTVPLPQPLTPAPVPQGPVPTPPPRRPIPKGKGKGGLPAKGKGKGGGYYYHSHGHGHGKGHDHGHSHGHYHHAHHGDGGIFHSMTPRKGSGHDNNYYRGKGMGGGGYYQQPHRQRYYGQPRRGGWW